MKILKTLKDLTAPRFYDFGIDLFEALYVSFESAGRHEFRHHDEALASFRILIFPSVVEANNVRVLETLEHLRFFLEALSLFSFEVPVL